MSGCKDCESIDVSKMVSSGKGNGRCRDCKGTGIDQASSALVQFGTLGLEGENIPCKTCSGTGQCQTCGGTGEIKEYHYSQRSSSSSDTSNEGYAWIGKIIGFLIVAFIVIWLVFAVVIPLVVIDIAIIALIVGLVIRKWNKFLFPLSILGAVYVVLDFNLGWFTKAFATNVTFLAGLIPILFYVNIVAGLVAAYFLIRNILSEKGTQTENTGEFSKRNLIIMGCLLMVGGLTIGLQKYFDYTQSPHGIRSTVRMNSNSNDASDRTIVDNSSNKANTKTNPSDSVRVPIATTNSPGSDNKSISDTIDTQAKPTNVSINNSTEKIKSINNFTDHRDGRVYKIVEIGNQLWMAENFAYKASNGCWAYNDDENNVSLYGYLYNWEAAKQNCPEGWHLPSNEEWRVLAKYLGGNEDAGGKLKEKTGWDNPHTTSTNSSGFTARHGGYRSSDGSFLSIDESGVSRTACAYWWTSSDNRDFATYKCVYSTSRCIQTGGFGKKAALSVRYIKD